MRPQIACLYLVAMTTGRDDAASALSSQGGGEIPRLLPPDPNKDIPTIRLGESIRFEEWGPIILNADGTTRRIANWDDMTGESQRFPELAISWFGCNHA